MNNVRATDALANERTLLAYVRTALAFIAFGFVIARFSLLLREAALLEHLKTASSGLSSDFGALMALAGVACAAFGGYRYVVGARALRADAVAPLSDFAALAIITVVVIIGAVVAFALPAFR